MATPTSHFNSIDVLYSSYLEFDVYIYDDDEEEKVMKNKRRLIVLWTALHAPQRNKWKMKWQKKTSETFSLLF